VRDITEHANLSRATFYLHYKDKEELLTKSLFTVFDEVIEQIGELSAESLLTFDVEMRKIPFEHARKYRDLYRVALVSENSLPAISNSARAYVSRQIVSQLQRILPENDRRVPLPVLANYLAGAYLGLISWWLEQDETVYTSDYIAEMFYWLSLPTLNLLLSIRNPPPPPSSPN